jgi:hypothetical protein
VEWQSRFRVTPLNLNMVNTMRLDGSLVPRFDFTQVNLRAGEINVIAVFFFYLSSTDTWEAQLAQIFAQFDPPGATIAIDALLCTERLFVALCGGGLLEVDLYLSAAVGNFTLDIRAIFIPLSNPRLEFYQVWIDLTVKVSPSVDIANSYVIDVDGFRVQSFSLTWKF